MFTWSTSQLPGRIIGFLLTTVALVSFLPVLAQQLPAKPAIAQYDLLSETAIKGTVDDVKLIGMNSKTRVLKLVIRTGAESIEVVLCPKSFLDDLGVSFSKGDQLEIKGSKVRHDDLDELLAREIVKGNDTVVLRDKQGKPVWN